MTSRRHVLTAFGAAAFAHPLALLAQQPPKIRRVGVLSHGLRPAQIDTSVSGAFLRGMRELGYFEGKNLAIEWRFADGQVGRLPDLATDLVRANVEVIVSFSTAATHALQKATRTIPIVMATSADPVGSAFVKSLARPGGNITGLTNMVFELRAKQLELLRSVAPKVARIAVLLNPESTANIQGFSVFEAAAGKLGIKAVSFDARTPQQIEHAFERMAKESIQAVLVIVDPIVFQHRRQIAESAMKLRLPSIGTDEREVEAGLLMSYGLNFLDQYRRAATYVDKILKGANPADLPIEQPMRFDFAVNKKTANALGITLPNEIMVRAERFIE